MAPLHNIFVFICTVIMMSGAFSSVAFAQARVTGHVFAEVVESVGASANTANLASVPQNMPDTEFELGEIAINGGSLAAFSIVVETGEMIAQSGERASFKAKTRNGQLVSNLDSNGRQTLKLSGSAQKDIALAGNRNFSAAYSVTFAYN